MIFHSAQFIIFFLIVTGLYFLAPGRARWVVLLAGSCYFYASGGAVFLAQVIAVTAGVFFLALKLDATGDDRKRSLVALGIVLLVLNLITFKYAAFLNESARGVAGAIGIGYSLPVFEALLPLGISFYTFQLISYLVDVTRKTVKAERHFGLFALYVMFFPKMVAGPIERAKSLLPQLHEIHGFDTTRVVAGLQLALWGMFKKVVVADRIAPIVAQVYDNPGTNDGVVTVLATWLYAFQIYCDFSGYTDIALGVALILGFKLSVNFNRPYAAVSIQDFWKRWHISLTSWLTDYVYTPLTRQKIFRIKFFNLMLIGLFATFVVSGFWHGANWTYVMWGALHGAYIVVSLLSRQWRARFADRIGLLRLPRVHHALKVVVTFNLVCFAYILFRSASIEDAFNMMGNLFVGWGTALYSAKTYIGANFSEIALSVIGIAIVVVADVLRGRMDLGAVLAARPKVRWALYYAGVASVVLLGAFYDSQQKFIYFRF